MADCNYAMEGWEWESIFASSLLEQGTSITSLQDDFSELEPTVAAAPAGMVHISGHPSSFPSAHFPDTIASPESLLKSKNGGASSRNPIASAIYTSDGSLESSDYNNDIAVTSHHLPSEASPNSPPTVIPSKKKKKKKRDPRLECPNFLAGRVPCSCPEEDELEKDVEVEDVVKKRPKVGARCQVPSCGGDISHLKGYHQRHRVCLGCANSPKVILKDQPHRYCQQCGKFHWLSDFDEGKRSCRRKLERHNKRRRRRPLEEQEGQDSGSGVPMPGIESDHNNVHSSIHAAATQEEWKTAASTKQSSDISPGTHHKKEAAGSTQDLVNPIIDHPRASDDSSASVLRFEQEFISSNKNELGDLSWLTMLMDDASEEAEIATRNGKSSTEEADIATRNGKQLHASKPELSRASYLSTSQRKHTEYVSPCPTGRISFKLYDWNPADFPRRLRQQIFKWLANMPVELESYIRSGCIILTFFIAMPQVMWDKILDDWIGQVQKLVLQPGTELWGTGQIIERMNEKRVYVRNGKVMSADQKEPPAPFLVDLYPLSLEAGSHTHIYVSGFNFSGARFLVSFGEHYLECSDCKPVDCHHFTHGTLWKSIDNLEIQKVTVFLPDSQKFGPAYVEVVSDDGVSNFMPMLVADKDVCAEINAARFSSVALASVNYNANTRHGKAEILRDQCGMDILTDLGWALRYMNEPRFIDKAEVRVKQLRGLLIFSLEHNWHVVAKRLVPAALTMGVIQNTGFISAGSEGQHVWNMMETLRDAKDIPISKGLSSLDRKVEQCSSLSPTIATIWEADNSDGVDSLSQLKGLQGPKSAVSKLKQLCLALMNSPFKECDNVVSVPAKDWTVMEVPLLEERVPILEDGLRQKDTCWARPLGWSRKPTRNPGSSTLCGSNRRLCRIVVTAVSIVTICTGMCFMLQHPHEVAEISMSLRRCLGGLTDSQHV